MGLRKNIFILIIITIVLLIVFVVLLISEKDKEAVGPGAGSDDPGELPISTEGPFIQKQPGFGSIPTSENLIIYTQDGSVTTNNFYKNAVRIDKIYNSNMVLIEDTDSYHFSYKPDNKPLFLISTTADPFESVRLVAEKAFLQRLGITENDACKLRVFIIDGNNAVPAKYGLSYSLSFCETP